MNLITYTAKAGGSLFYFSATLELLNFYPL